MDQASGLRESSLQPLLCLSRDEKQRCRCRERWPDKGKLRLQESRSLVLPGICFLNLLFKVRRPGVSHQQPHQQRGGHREASLIEESNWNETKNQAGAAPEPDVLMKHVKYDDSKNKQEVFHGGQKLTRPSGRVKLLYPQITQSRRQSANLWIKVRTLAGRDLGAQGTGVLTVNVMSLDHAVESLAIDGEHAGRGLLVAARVFEHTSNVPSLDL